MTLIFNSILIKAQIIYNLELTIVGKNVPYLMESYIQIKSSLDEKDKSFILIEHKRYIKIHVIYTKRLRQVNRRENEL